MNDSLHNNDETLIDRLVDGELSGEERRQLLAELDVQHDGWRRCALAFLEAQTWRNEMRRVVEPAAAISEKECDVAIAPVNASTSQHSQSTWRKSSPWLAVAAALMLAFGIGRQMGVGDRSELSEAQLANADLAAPSREASPQQKHPTGDAVTLVVNDNQGVPHRLSVPLVEGRHLGDQFSETPHWSSPELARRLSEEGLGIAARRRYAPLYFEQQDQQIPLFVPVDDAVVTPVSRPVY